jgi:hypothetical protein
MQGSDEAIRNLLHCSAGPSVRIRVQTTRMQRAGLHRLRGSNALRFGLRRRAHWLSASWVSWCTAVTRCSGSSEPRRERNIRLGQVKSRYDRRLPLAQPRLPMPRSHALRLPLRPINAPNPLRIRVCRSRLHEGVVKQPMPGRRIAVIRRRPRKQSRRMHPRSLNSYRRPDRRLRPPVVSRDHRHLLSRERQSTVLVSLHLCLPLRSINPTHVLRILLYLSCIKNNLQAVTTRAVRAQVARMLAQAVRVLAQAVRVRV